MPGAGSENLTGGKVWGAKSAVGFHLLALSPSFVGFVGQEILTRNSVAVEICLFSMVLPKGGFYEQLCQERADDPASLM